MSRRNISDRGQDAVEALRAAHLTYVHDKAVMRAQVELEIRERLSALELNRAQAARECLALGVPKSLMLEAVGTKNYGTIDSILSVGADSGAPAPGAQGVLDGLMQIDGAWYATSPDGCTMRLNASGRGFELDYVPGPEGREWDESPILPTPGWESWHEKHADLISEHVRAA